MKKRKSGFTLFELLVSISIIGILVVLAVISYSSAQVKARDARRIQDMSNIQKAAEQYYSKNNYTYPVDTAAFVSGGVLEAWPLGPKGVGVGDTYRYSIGTTYCTCARMESVSMGNSTNNSCTFGTGTTGPYFCAKSQQ